MMGDGRIRGDYCIHWLNGTLHFTQVLQRHSLHTLAQIVYYVDSFFKSNLALKIGQVGRTVYDCYVFQCDSEVTKLQSSNIEIHHFYSPIFTACSVVLYIIQICTQQNRTVLLTGNGIDLSAFSPLCYQWKWPDMWWNTRVVQCKLYKVDLTSVTADFSKISTINFIYLNSGTWILSNYLERSTID